MKKTSWKLFVVVLAALMASCSPKSTYTNALPKDAAMVMSMDLQTMAHKSGLDGEEGEKVKARLADALKSGLQGDAYRTVEKVINQPSESGLSFSDKVYFFITPHSAAYGILARVADEGKVEQLMKTLQEEQICGELTNESGCTWTQMDDAICAFSDDAFLLMGSAKGDAPSLRGSLLALMRQDTPNSFVDTPEFDKLQGAKGEMAAVANMTIIPNDLTMQLRMGLSADIRLEDMKYLLSASFEDGKVIIDSEALITDKTLVEMYEKQSKAMSSIEGTYLDCFPANTMAWMGMNLDGQAIYQLLAENPTVRQALENPMMPIDLQRIFSAIKGDVALGFSSLSDNALLMYANVTESSFLQTFEDLRPLLALTGGMMELVNLGTDQYELKMYGESFWFGVKDDMFYLTNKAQLAEEAGRSYGASLEQTPWADRVTDSRGFGVFNMTRLVEDLKENPRLTRTLGGRSAALFTILGPIDYIDVRAADWRTGQMNIVMKDQKVNALRQIVRIIDSL